MTSPALLTVNALCVSYADADALSEVSVDVAHGSVVAVIGANGAGKTTLIRTIAGLLRPKRGSIVFEGQDITGWPTHRTVAVGVAQVAEGRQIFPSLSVRDNLLLGAHLVRARKRRSESFEEVFALFPRLAERQRQPAGTLSGGEQQMVAIGRCLMSRPRLMLLDEPSQGLAPSLVRTVFDGVARLRQQGLTIMLVEQNVTASLELADYAYVLENGRVVLSGSSAAVAADAGVRRAYLGLG